jgi:RNA polymerase-binding transcription factor DksA
MRYHFHRCAHLRTIEVRGDDLGHARKGGRQVLAELCNAKRLAPCLGLVECDVLSSREKRELLAVRATRLREEEGGASLLADANAADPRRAELEDLRRALLDERNAIAEENRRLAAEAGGALQRNPRPLGRTESRELAGTAVSVVLDDELRALRAARLDALDRALDALATGRLGDCVRCGAPIDVERLRETPDTAVCTQCAAELAPELSQHTG